MGDRLRKVSGRGYTFWDRVDFSGDCWEWLSSKNHNGYGRLYFNGKSRKAHQIAYELLIGEIPKGLEIDHLCGNRGCVNVSHFDITTHAENTRRARRNTHCGYGHEFTEGNTYIRPDGARACKACQRRITYDWRKRILTKQRVRDFEDVSL